MSDNSNTILELQPLDFESVENIISIRLSKQGNHVILLEMDKLKKAGTLQYVTEFKQSIINKKNPQRNPILSLPYFIEVYPEWDIIFHPDGSHYFVIGQTGGAMSKLKIIDNKSEYPITTLYPHESFHSPRFIKGLSNQLPLSITTTSDSDKIVAFKIQPESEKIRYRELGKARNARLLRLKNDYILVAQTYSSGSVRLISPPGFIEITPLNGSLEKTQDSFRPLGNTKIYEYDVDIIQLKNNRIYIVLFAIADNSNYLLLYDIDSNKISHEITINGDFDAKKLSNPSVVVIDNQHIYIAALEINDETSERIFAGSTTIVE